MPDGSRDEWLHCPFCDHVFERPVPPSTPAKDIGRDFRDHLHTEHPVQDRDLKTTRWHDGMFLRCEPEQARGPRLSPSRSNPPPGHGLARLLHLDERESDDGPMAVFCTCGFKDVGYTGRRQALAALRWHWARGQRIECPYCGWRWEWDVREDVEREMALHIGMAHATRFPWGYGDAAEPVPIP